MAPNSSDAWNSTPGRDEASLSLSPAGQSVPKEFPLLSPPTRSLHDSDEPSSELSWEDTDTEFPSVLEIVSQTRAHTDGSQKKQVRPHSASKSKSELSSIEDDDGNAGLRKEGGVDSKAREDVNMDEDEWEGIRGSVQLHHTALSNPRGSECDSNENKTRPKSKRELQTPPLLSPTPERPAQWLSKGKGRATTPEDSAAYPTNEIRGLIRERADLFTVAMLTGSQYLSLLSPEPDGGCSGSNNETKAHHPPGNEVQPPIRELACTSGRAVAGSGDRRKGRTTKSSTVTFAENASAHSLSQPYPCKQPGSPEAGPSRVPPLTAPPPFLSQPQPRKRARSASRPSHSQPPPSTAPPPSKRARMSYVPSTVGKYRRSQSHWRLDGSLLVQLDKTRYNLHRSRLVELSAWFRDLLDGDPELASVQRTRRKCIVQDGEKEVVKLDPLGLSVKDFEALLNAFDKVVMFFRAPPPYLTTLSILTASHVLDVSTFYDWALDVILKTWPSNLDDIMPTRISHATETITAVRRCKLPTRILKRALYELSRHEVFHLEQDFYAANGDPHSDNGEGEDEGEGADCVIVSKRPQPLHDDIYRLLSARNWLSSRWNEELKVSEHWKRCYAHGKSKTGHGSDLNTNSMPTPSSSTTPSSSSTPTTPTTTTCRSLLPNVKEVHERLIVVSNLFAEFQHDVICGYQALIELPWEKEGFCAACAGKRREVWKLTKARAWRDLDDRFGLKGRK